MDFSLQYLMLFSIIGKTETEVPRLDELEREEIEETVEEEQLEEEQLAEEQPEEEEPEEEQIEELPGEEQPPEKPAKPIKGPRFLAWSVAVLLMLFGLVLALPALWNLVLSIPALSGLASEAARKYDSAAEAYELLYSTDMTAQGWGVPGLTSGKFYYERMYVVTDKREGPLAIVQSQTMPPISDAFPERVPRSLRKIAARCEALSGIVDAFYELLSGQGQPAEGQGESEWLLGVLETVRGADGQADAHGLYYEAIALMHTAGDSEQKQANLARIEALKKHPAGEFWMYGDYELYYALQDEDYAALAAAFGARAKRDREDFASMQRRVKALYLSAGETEALAAAKKYARRPAARNIAQVAKAEVCYRQGRCEDAIALCDGILEKAVPAAETADGKGDFAAMEAATVKATALLLQGRPGEAVELLEAVQENPYGGASVSFPYTLLAAYAVQGEWEGEAAQQLAMMLSYYGYDVPESIADLGEGKTTVEKIFTEGWGGFDV